MAPAGILFDLDGTILDTLDDLLDSTNWALRQFAFPERSREQVRQFVGNGAKRLISLAVPEGTTPQEIEAVFAAFQEYYPAHCRIKTKPYDGVIQALQTLHDRGYVMGVVSNKPDEAVKQLAKEYFPGLYALGETVSIPRKPAPDMVWEGAKALGKTPGECIYVGDSEVDIATARGAGMVCLSVTWGFREEAFLRAQGGTAFCRCPEELVTELTRLEEMMDGK